MPKQKCPPPGAPGWVVTYGDLMSLLLTFFIMLFSMSTMEEVKVDAVAESLSSQFGYSATQITAPGSQRPANSNRSQVRSTGRAKRKDTLSGGNPVISPQGDQALVRAVRKDKEIVQGGIVYFELGSDELTEQAREDIRIIADQLRGSPYKIEVKGHTSRETGIYENNLHTLSYLRAERVRQEMIRLGVDGRLIELTAVGPDEPVATSYGQGRTGAQANAFVEVQRLLKTAGDYTDDNRMDYNP